MGTNIINKHGVAFMGHSCRILHYSNNTSADDIFIITAKTDINQFISGKPIHFRQKSQSMVSVQNFYFN
jgi:hypothetical protein